MTLETCYHQLGGSYSEVRARIPSDALIKKFVAAFLKDTSFSDLCGAMDASDRTTAFRAAHTLKGVCANMGFEKLRSSSSELAERLRNDSDTIPAEAFSLLTDVKSDYQRTVDAISAFLSEE